MARHHHHFHGIHIHHHSHDQKEGPKRVMPPKEIKECEKSKYDGVLRAFRAAGFMNIRCVPIKDLSSWTDPKANRVESITINNEIVSSRFSFFSPYDPVVIKYHCVDLDHINRGSDSHGRSIATKEDDKKICHFCGAELVKGGKFCTACGKPVD